jgi:threonyl-tRNA synthetase
MNNKYYVVSKNGSIIDPKEYLESDECSEEFAVAIKREVFDEGVNRGMEGDKNHSDYLFFSKKLGFDWERNSEGGFLSYDYKAKLIINLISEYARQLVKKIGFPVFEVSGANFFDLSYPVVQAYAGLYGDRLFQFKLQDKSLVMSYDASYPQFNLAGKYSLSYKQLPFAHFSVSDCYRNEQSGELMSLYRQRRFYMPDLHPYFKDVGEAFSWYPKIQSQILEAAKDANRHFHIVAEIASVAYWEQCREGIVGIAKDLCQEMLVIVDDDNKDRYWIINVDYKIVDQFRQSREIACIQIDVGNAKRLGIAYVDKDGKKVNPVIIHSAVPGGIERFIYMLMDNFQKSFPIWLYPSQVRLIPVNDKHVAFCKKLIEMNASEPIRMEIDNRNVGVSGKVKKAHEDLIPYPVVIGDREVNDGAPDLEKICKEVVSKSAGKPFLPLSYPRLLSQQVV